MITTSNHRTVPDGGADTTGTPRGRSACTWLAAPDSADTGPDPCSKPCLAVVIDCETTDLPGGDCRQGRISEP